LDLPEDCVLIQIIRNCEIILPRGNTLLHVGDKVEIFGMEDKLAEVEKHLSS
jgi:Trk K+ transport system NAD-binding subunit